MVLVRDVEREGDFLSLDLDPADESEGDDCDLERSTVSCVARRLSGFFGFGADEKGFP
jgi:hypothetical protein